MAKSKEMDEATEGSPLRDLIGFLLLAVSVFSFISIISYHPMDPSWNTVTSGSFVQNYGGMVGSYLADVLMQFFGYAAYLLPLALLGATWSIVFRPTFQGAVIRLIGFLFIVISFSLFLALLGGDAERLVPWGGATGYWLRKFSLQYTGVGGTYLAALTALALSLVLTVGLTFSGFVWFVSVCGAAVHALSRTLWKTASAVREGVGQVVDEGEKEITKGMKEIRKVEGPRLPERIKIAGEEMGEDLSPPEAIPEIPIVVQNQKKKPEKTALPKFHSLEEDSPSPKEEKTARNYKLPGLHLLEAPEEQILQIDRDELFQNAQTLERKLKDFGVFGKVVEVQPGPVVTMYEFEPAPGVKVNQITRLNDDLALALKAISVRIEPIPGKAVIGIEVANRNRQIVYLKEILANEAFSSSSSFLTLATGKDISGTPVVADLRRMPHLLVAGATGSGKSVAVNSFILSILYKSTPEEVRMILVDPKMLELSLYDGIPHLMLPVVTDPRKSAAALRWAVTEMERRYRLMADIGVRNIEGYNKKVPKVLSGEEKKEPEPLIPEEATLALEPSADPNRKAEEHTGKLPFIVIVIDELADLMMVSSREVEESIIRLAQMARAAGIHLMLATQRPSVDVITGVIKANMPARISFQVASKIDSRTILDSNGAELLLGAGDMLFLPPGTSKLQRIHGAFVTDNEVKRVTDFWKEQGKPEYFLDILKIQEEQVQADLEVESGEDEDIYRQALNVVRAHRVASISMIQRKLRIGYNRAARIVERMEEEGLLAPGEVGKPREVIMSRLEGF